MPYILMPGKQGTQCQENRKSRYTVNESKLVTIEKGKKEKTAADKDTADKKYPPGGGINLQMPLHYNTCHHCKQQPDERSLFPEIDSSNWHF